MHYCLDREGMYVENRHIMEPPLSPLSLEICTTWTSLQIMIPSVFRGICQVLVQWHRIILNCNRLHTASSFLFCQLLSSRRYEQSQNAMILFMLRRCTDFVNRDTPLQGCRATIQMPGPISRCTDPRESQLQYDLADRQILSWSQIATSSHRSILYLMAH